MATTAQAQQKTADEPREVLEVLRDLLGRRDDAAVVQLVEKLLTTHDRQLREMIEKARRRPNKNEGVDRRQLTMLLEQLAQRSEDAKSEADQKLEDAADVPPPQAPPANKPNKPPPRRRPIPPNLPRIDNEIPVPADERSCPVCGAERTCIGHETTLVIDIEPARAIVREDRREKVACEPCGSEVVTAPLGDKVIEGGAYGSNLVASLVVGKYADGLPLYRQGERLSRIGLDMPSSSMGDQIAWATELLQPIWRELQDDVLGSHVMHGDATSLPVLDRDTPKGKKTGALWAWVGCNIVVEDGVACEEHSVFFNYATTGKKTGQKVGELGPEDILELRRARGLPHVVVDAASVFDAAFNRPGLIEVGCNAHARRYFTKALEAGDVRAALPIAAFKKLYDVEEKTAAMPPTKRLATRLRESKPVYDELLDWCRTYKAAERPKSSLGRAVRYLLNHEVAFTRFLEDGTLPIDNTIVERQHRKPAVGRRNYLFAGSDAGAERAAIAYSVLGTCRLLGINPTAYLSDVLPILARGLSVARDLPALMPRAWALRHV